MSGATPLDRRQRRRQETIEQVLDVAAEVMAAEGVAGLTLGEVARRMGIRTPSLYVYVDSKNALYDALFERGWRTCLAAVDAAHETALADGPAAAFGAGREAFVRWALEHPAYTPLMMWRPVPGFVPSERAYAPALETVARTRDVLARLQDEGVLAPGTAVDLLFRTLSALVTGVITQQLTNAPDEPVESGSYTSTLPVLMDMWFARFGRRT